MSDPILLGIPGALRKASTNRLLLKEAVAANNICIDDLVAVHVEICVHGVKFRVAEVVAIELVAVD